MLALSGRARHARRRRPCLCEAIASYLIALRAERRSEATIRHYQERLIRLRDIARDPALASISAGMLRRSLLRVKSDRRDGRRREVSDRYVFQHHAVWRAFFNWCRRDGRMRRASPMAAIRPPRVDEAELAPFTRDEVRRLLAMQDPRTFEGARNFAIIALLFDTGMRVGELVRLELGDVGTRSILIRKAKSRRARRVPLSGRMRRVLRAYIARWQRPALFPSLAPARLFPAKSGRPLHENGVRQWMRDAGRAADIATRSSPHTWRHTFATEYLLGGGTVEGLMLILGIASSRVLDRYVHLVRTRYAADEHRRASPLTRL